MSPVFREPSIDIFDFPAIFTPPKKDKGVFRVPTTTTSRDKDKDKGMDMSNFATPGPKKRNGGRGGILASPTKPIIISDTPLPKPPPPAALQKSVAAAKRNFIKIREQLASEFLRELDEKVAGGMLAERSACIGGCGVTWSKNLKTTAGMFRYKKLVFKDAKKGTMEGGGGSTKSTNWKIVGACIELAEKVCDEEERLYSTLAHEFAHAADMIVSENYGGKAHGKGFNSWYVPLISSYMCVYVWLT